MKPEDLDKEQELPASWEPKEGESIIGILVRKQENVGKYHSNAYRLRVQDTNEVKTVWGSKIIDEKLVEQDAQFGDTIGIKFVGEKTAKDNKTKYKDFTVLVEKPVQAGEQAEDGKADDSSSE